MEPDAEHTADDRYRMLTGALAIAALLAALMALWQTQSRPLDEQPDQCRGTPAGNSGLPAPATGVPGWPTGPGAGPAPGTASAPPTGRAAASPVRPCAPSDGDRTPGASALGMAHSSVESVE
ncbi:hypothetical protein [Streptomyces sp. NPDC049585]|uniref:hypothetical protein n=1 Tax=Streptomyces sp. NPDC049585 TaxID=3155154 RepID=UPI003449D17C